MPRAKRGETTEERERYHVWLDREDADWIKMAYGSTIGFSGGIRGIVKAYRKRIEAVAAHRALRVEAEPTIDVEANDENE